MNLNADWLNRIVLWLENEGEFYRGYMKYQNSTYGLRRSFINEFIYGHRTAFRCPAPDIEARDQIRRYFDDRYGLPQDESNKYAHIPYWRELKPRAVPNTRLKPLVQKIVGVSTDWVDLRPQYKAPTAASLAHRFGYTLGPTEDQQVADAVDEAFAQLTQPVKPQLIKEDIMTTSKTAINITTKTFINGEDVANMSDSQVYDLIAQQEKDIEKLESIKHKPKKLVKEIEDRKAGIAALVAYLDSKEA